MAVFTHLKHNTQWCCSKYCPLRERISSTANVYISMGSKRLTGWPVGGATSQSRVGRRVWLQVETCMGKWKCCTNQKNFVRESDEGALAMCRKHIKFVRSRQPGIISLMSYSLLWFVKINTELLRGVFTTQRFDTPV